MDPRGWDDTEVSAAQASAGVVASLLGAAAKAELKGALAELLEEALSSRVLIERAKGALMERERLDDQDAFTHLRRAARSFRPCRPGQVGQDHPSQPGFFRRAHFTLRG